MADVDVKELLNPLGPAMQEVSKGTRYEGRVAVAAHWPSIEEALNAGRTMAQVYRVLHKAGLIKVTERSFVRQVQARREGARGAGAAAKPAAEAQALPELVGAEETREPEALPARSGEAETVLKAPGGSGPSWLREPPPATNRHAIYKPPAPKSES